MSTVVPDGYRTVCPFLVVESLEREAEFLRLVFGAEIRDERLDSDGNVSHVEVRIGDTIIMMDRHSTEFPAFGSMTYVWVSDVDATFQAALTHEAESVAGPTDSSYGTREAGFRDPQGNVWWIGRPIRRPSNAEVERRLTEQRRQRL